VDAVIGNFVRARGLGVVEGIDMENTGRVDKILTDSLGCVLDQGMVSILPCIGYSPAGKPYNVPSDEIALAAAEALGAVKLFFVSLSGGLRAEDYKLPGGVEMGEDGRVVRLTPLEAEAILAANAAGQGDPRGTGDRPLQELAMALAASRAGVERIHIVDGREDGAILRELFSNLGSGTMLYTDEYDSIRPLRSRDISIHSAAHGPLDAAGHSGPAPRGGYSGKEGGLCGFRD